MVVKKSHSTDVVLRFDHGGNDASLSPLVVLPWDTLTSTLVLHALLSID